MNADGLMAGPDTKPISLTREEFRLELAKIFPCSSDGKHT